MLQPLLVAAIFAAAACAPFSHFQCASFDTLYTYTLYNIIYINAWQQRSIRRISSPQLKPQRAPRSSAVLAA